MTKRCRSLLLALALVLIAGVSHAQTEPSSPIQQDLYLDALQSIAEGRRDDASEELERMIDKEPLHAGAWLDLALTQCSLGHADEAERLFAAIETRFNPPPGILEVIAKARDQGCNHWQPHSASTLALARGNDQNVNQGASSSSYMANLDGIPVQLPLLPAFLPMHDQYTVLSAEYLRDITPNGSVGFVQFQDRSNDHLTQYDSASLFLGMEIPQRFGHWALHNTGMVGFIGLGGQLYERLVQLQTLISPPLPLPDSTQFGVMAGFTRTEYPTLVDFNTSTYEIRGQLTFRHNEHYVTASLGLLDDIANSQRPGGNRHGWLANLLARQRLYHDMTGELAYTRQNWQSQSAYSPGLIDETPAQTTQVLRATLIYPVTKNQSVQFELREVHNNENISIFQYNDRQFQVSWQWQTR